MKSFIGGLVNSAPVAYTSQRLTMPFMRRDNSETYMKSLGSVSTLFAIVSRITDAVSQTDWKLYRHTDSRGRIAGDEKRKEVTSHHALDIWNKPNDFYTQQQFVESFQQHYELTGEAWWLVGRDSRATIPMELWPVRPDKIAPIPHPVDFISGYEYTSPDGVKIPLGLEDVLLFKRPNPLDPYRGMGPVQSLLTDLDSVRYSAEWNRNFFLNSAEPGGIIETDKSLSDPEFDKFQMRWNEQHRGVANAHRVAILEKGKWVDRSYSQKDMQFAELRNVSREIIREAFAFPKPLLGGVDNVNRANAEAGEVVFARWLVVPRLERIKQVLNHHFLPLFGVTGQGLEFDYESPVPEDSVEENAELTARVNAFKTLVDAGVDPDSAAEIVDLPPMVMKKIVTPPPLPPVLPPGGDPNAVPA